MDITLPTQAQKEDMKRPNRKNWTALYNALEEHKALMVPADDSKRMAYQHFKKQGRKVRWKYYRDTDQYGIWLDE